MADDFRAALDALVRGLFPGTSGAQCVQRLSAGATLQTWSFGAASGSERHALIMRRSPGGLRSDDSVPLAIEAALLRAIHGTGVPVPEVVHVLQASDGLGDGFIMRRIEGETIPRKILRDPAFATARARLVAQMAQTLATIHSLDTSGLPPLPVRTAAGTLAVLVQRQRGLSHASSVFEWALRWLGENLPSDPPSPSLVHGDFRLGNVIVDEGGLRAVLDWENAHLGDPAEDLAWICLPPWRFGRIDHAVAGIAPRGELYSAWEAATGNRVEPERVRWWQAAGSMRWGLGCAGMQEWFTSGRDATVERGMIGRRVSENELDLLRLLASGDEHA